MTFDLATYINFSSEPSDFVPEMQKYLQQFGLIIEAHPQFSLLESEGCQPFKLKKESQFFNPNLPFDLIISNEIDLSDPDKWHNENEPSPFAKATHIVNYCANSFSPLEITFSILFSSYLLTRFDGLIIDFQSGQKINKDQIHQFIKSYLDKLKPTITEKEFFKFEGWL